jgi:hypothetical protein
MTHVARLQMAPFWSRSSIARAWPMYLASFARKNTASVRSTPLTLVVRACDFPARFGLALLAEQRS